MTTTAPVTPVRTPPTEDEIRQTAYILWEVAGEPEDWSLSILFWLQAEFQLTNAPLPE